MILGASILQLPAIREAKKMGHTVIAVDMDKNAVGFKDADICEVISTIDVQGVLNAARKHHIDGIMTLASDMPMRTVAKVAKELGLIGISEETAFKATNKYAMREALKNYDVPVPEFYKAVSKEEYIDALKKISKDIIVKPADNSGSRGIYFLENLVSEEKINLAYDRAKKFSRSGEIMIEECMTGQEISVETLSVCGSCNVIQITDKITTGLPYCVEMGHTQPSHFCSNVKLHNSIEDVAKKATYAIGIENGPAHVEIMVTSEGPKVVELGARLGGDCITTDLVPLSTGVNMVKESINVALNEPTNLKNECNKGAAIRYFKTRIGNIKKIEGIDKAKIIPGIKRIEITRDVGCEVVEIRSSLDRVGFVIAQGVTAKEASLTCEKALNTILVQIGG